MELVLGIIAVIATIALMPVIFLVGMLVVAIVLGIVMMPFAWIIGIAETIKTKKEIARKRRAFEEMKKRVEEVNKNFRERMQ